ADHVPGTGEGEELPVLAARIRGEVVADRHRGPAGPGPRGHVVVGDALHADAGPGEVRADPLQHATEVRVVGRARRGQAPAHQIDGEVEGAPVGNATRAAEHGHVV